MEYILKPALLWIESIENDTVKEMHNDTVLTILQLLEEMNDINKTIYESYLFNFIDDYKDNYLEDFSSRLAQWSNKESWTLGKVRKFFFMFMNFRLWI